MGCAEAGVVTIKLSDDQDSLFQVMLLVEYPLQSKVSLTVSHLPELLQADSAITSLKHYLQLQEVMSAGL